MSFSDLPLGNDFLENPDTFEQISDFYTFDIYTFINYIFESVWVSVRRHVVMYCQIQTYVGMYCVIRHLKSALAL